VLHDVALLAAKAVMGGALVSVFALLGRVLRPKWFAGLFGAAPSVAIASLTLTVLDKGNHAASIAGAGMCFGAAGFVAFGICVRPMLARYGAVVATSLSCAAWILVAVGAYLVVVG
jgi:hypothetical protein